MSHTAGRAGAAGPSRISDPNNHSGVWQQLCGGLQDTPEKSKYRGHSQMQQEPFHDRSARPLSPEQREALAESWVKAAGELHGGPVALLSIIDKAKIQFVEWSAERLGADEARAYTQVRTIVARPELYRQVMAGDIASLMKLAHEFGHFMLNENAAPKPLKFGGNTKYRWIRDEDSEEMFAWQLGRAVMMPRAFIRDCDSVQSIAQRFFVPLDQAAQRLAELRHERRKNLQSIVKPAKPKLSVAEDLAWSRAAIDDDHDPEYYRLSHKNFLVSLFGCNQRKHPLGWFLQNGKIYANDELDPSWF